MKLNLPENVKKIISLLQNAGFEAYAVGGCVRDSILERAPNDWDITTSAMPDQIKSIFRRTADTGFEHGTVTVLIGRDSYEVTTYRIDNEYKDARHPSSVSFTASLNEDLKRRDFTINAMAYNDEDGIIDPFGGLEDIKRKKIRCVGDPFARLSEDALRIMRAIRFSAQLSFEIDDMTENAIRILTDRLEKISIERICSELIKIIVSPHPEYLINAYEMGITKVFFGEFDLMMQTSQNSRYHDCSVGEHTIRSMRNIEPDRTLRLTMLLHDIGKPFSKTTDPDGTEHFKGHGELGMHLAKSVMRRFKLDNVTIRKVTLLIRYHDLRFNAEPKNVRAAVSLVGRDMFPELIKVWYADNNAKSSYKKKTTLDNIAAIEEIFSIIVSENQCVSIDELDINGSDILRLGALQGPEIGKLLNKALMKVIDDPACNKKEFLINYLKNIMNEGKK